MLVAVANLVPAIEALELGILRLVHRVGKTVEQKDLELIIVVAPANRFQLLI